MPTKTTKPPPPSRRRPSKVEVQQEFDTIRREAEAAREAANPKSVEAEQRHSAEVRQAVEEISVDSVAQQISAVGGQISRTLIDLTERLTSEVDLLAKVRQAVQLERQELERLHKIDVAATSIDQLVQDYERDQERLKTEI